MKHFLHVCGVVGILLNSIMADVVVSCKPLYFVVAPLIKGVDTPKLLINHGQCGHHHHARPSEILLIKSAKLVVWNGSTHEPFMSKLIGSAKANIKVFDETDGFSWLSPNEVIKKLPAVVGALKSVYPECDHATIDANAKVFIEELQKLHEKTQLQLQPLSGKSILTTYPVLTYFANAYGLVVSGYMMGSPEESMTPQRLRNVYKVLEERRVIGVIKDHHVPINVVQNLVQKYKLPILTVDTEGVDIPASTRGYNILIERLAQSIVKWAQ
ncbi:metal ABC transporter substrate-binding protein [Candidatus Bodocaedibacter vickermanii]|uniref:High-affinity zinc uptake system protein ZnuA n=1 Tax=Candidatus Bodocaedibacter vickermanii TaxID=2741701 RepID=A0A7L9RUS3_9PROT|nr:High-affinity zinc uptake system protein ZnuA [Candidatus Paracaedibacteraceae bacterium 'Lake Konstanz']